MTYERKLKLALAFLILGYVLIFIYVFFILDQAQSQLDQLNQQVNQLDE